MKSPKFAKRIILLGMSIVVALFIEFGTLGYVVYGCDIKPSISLNLKSNNTAETMWVAWKLSAATLLICWGIVRDLHIGSYSMPLHNELIVQPVTMIML